MNHSELEVVVAKNINLKTLMIEVRSYLRCGFDHNTALSRQL
jgi:hypothetical protein